MYTRERKELKRYKKSK
uniref:Uncharacterized protein n=1 Tax=Anguilla anguilla TaxID=7936 RepID=A0A0E9QME8_ANGAN